MGCDKPGKYERLNWAVGRIVLWTLTLPLRLIGGLVAMACLLITALAMSVHSWRELGNLMWFTVGMNVKRIAERRENGEVP